MKNIFKYICFFTFLLLVYSNLQAQVKQYTSEKSYCLCDTIEYIVDTNDYSLIVFYPINSSLALTDKRPDTNNADIIFSVPAAFTARNYKDVVGKFATLDTIIYNQTEQETGFCLINDSIVIAPLDTSDYSVFTNIQIGKDSYFQQMLLVNNDTLVPCTIFGKQKPTFRRALCIKNNRICVIESLNRMNVDDFSSALIANNVSQAIYMDMGTWSEGFYIDENGKKNIIGRLKQNTKYQSNWLLFLKK